jgi:gas vesicle protein
MKKIFLEEEYRTDFKNKMEELADEHGFEHYYAQVITGYDEDELNVTLNGASTTNITEVPLLRHCINEASALGKGNREEGYGLGTVIGTAIGTAVAGIAAGWIGKTFTDKARRKRMKALIEKDLSELVNLADKDEEELKVTINGYKKYIAEHIIHNMKDLGKKERDEWRVVLVNIMELEHKIYAE